MPLLGDLFRNLSIRYPARGLALAELTTRLERSGAALTARCDRAAGTNGQRARLRHVIGIERWGQRRLATFLGQGPVMDEYDGYQPADTLDWPTLREAFATTRQETIALARQIAEADIGDDTKVRHNAAGDLDAREWLYYLASHANRESLTIR
jgi:hypothetical protein